MSWAIVDDAYRAGVRVFRVHNLETDELREWPSITELVDSQAACSGLLGSIAAMLGPDIAQRWGDNDLTMAGLQIEVAALVALRNERRAQMARDALAADTGDGRERR